MQLLGPEFSGSVVQISGGESGPLGRFVAVRKQVRAFDGDIVHPYLEECCVFVSLASLGKSSPKVVWGVRNSGILPMDYPLKIRMINKVAKWLAPLPHMVVFNSEAGRRSYSGVKSQHLTVIPNGIDSERFRPAKNLTEALEVRKRFGIPPHVPVIAFVGRDDPMKGIEDFIKIARILLDQHRDCHIVIVGLESGSIPADLLQSERVSVLGRVEYPEEIMMVCDVLVSTSRYGEGFPNVIGEAISSGCRVIATDVGDCRSVVGTSGFVFAPGQIDAMTTAIIRELETPISNDERWEANLKIKNQFGLETLVRRSEDVFLQIASGK